MQNMTARGASASSERFENVACPFCGMLCDDLVVERDGETLKVRKNGCGKAVEGFERNLPKSSPQIRGADADYPKAIAAAAELIRSAKFPLYGGLSTDVEGMRALLALAERSGGAVDHAFGEALYRNFRVLQSAGWTTTTLTETRNRADFILILGGELLKLHPRFAERIVAPAESMFEVNADQRIVVILGEGPEPSGVREVVRLPCAVDKIGEVLGALRAKLRGLGAGEWQSDGITSKDIDAFAERCRAAKYGVVVWSPAFLDFPHAEFTIDQISGLVKDLNQTTRFAGLSLGGAEGATTAAAVSTWQSGYPLRLSYAKGAPDYDPELYAIPRMLAEGRGDLLVWIASFSPELAPPQTDLPTVVLGTPGLALPRRPEVLIPIGTPGVDHAGRQIRVDNVVSLPLKDLGRSELPPAASVLGAIEAAL